MNEHTPGPWEWKDGELIAPRHGRIMNIARNWQHPNTHNKRLIAAAPDLLEALNSVNTILAVWSRDPAKLPNTLLASIRAVTEQAIRKATVV